jgi:hypothetical protein
LVRPALAKFQTGECRTGPGVVGIGFAIIGLNVIFPLAVAGQQIANMSFAFEAGTDIAHIVSRIRIIGEII